MGKKPTPACAGGAGFLRDLVAVEQRPLDIPQFLRQIHIIVMGVFKALDLVPKGIHLPLAVGPAGLEVGNFIHQLPALDEYIIRDLVRQGARIDSFGVGERLITSRSEPVFGGGYKLAAAP